MWHVYVEPRRKSTDNDSHATQKNSSVSPKSQWTYASSAMLRTLSILRSFNKSMVAVTRKWNGFVRVQRPQERLRKTRCELQGGPISENVCNAITTRRRVFSWRGGGSEIQILKMTLFLRQQVQTFKIFFWKKSIQLCDRITKGWTERGEKRDRERDGWQYNSREVKRE